MGSLLVHVPSSHPATKFLGNPLRSFLINPADNQTKNMDRAETITFSTEVIKEYL